MQTKSSLLTYKTISRQEAQGYLLRAVDLVRGNLGQFTDCFPYSNSQGGFTSQVITGNGPRDSGPGKYGWPMK